MKPVEEYSRRKSFKKVRREGLGLTALLPPWPADDLDELDDFGDDTRGPSEHGNQSQQARRHQGKQTLVNLIPKPVGS